MGATAAQAKRRAQAVLAAAGVTNAPLDARLLVQAACKVNDTDMVAHGDMPFGRMAAFQLSRLLARRMAGEPVSRILGRREFWGMAFTVTPDTLDPRPDTETLVEAALAWARARGGPIRILDLGTGSGCILIALLKELPGATGIGIDISEGALTAARENAVRNGVADRAELRCGSWFAPLANGESFDLIVSNPPYIAESDMESLAIEVKNHDPRQALTDGKDGFEAYKTIYPQLHSHLTIDGMAFLEMGYTQSAHMARLIEDAGATLEKIIKDLAGHERVVAVSIAHKRG